MEEKRFRIQKMLEKILIYIGLMAVMITLLIGFFSRNLSSMLASNMKVHEYYLYLMLAMAVMGLLIIRLFAWIERANERKLLVFRVLLWLFSIAAMLAVLVGFRIVPITDGWIMMDEARYLAQHPGEIIDSSNAYFVYFGRYGNNAFMTTALVWLFKIIGNMSYDAQYYLLYGMNAAALLLGNWFIYATVRMAADKRSATKTLTLLVMNPLSYLLILWFYSCSFSIPFMTGIVFLAVFVYQRFAERKIWPVVVLIGILSALAYLIRPTSFFPILAIIAVFILRYYPKKSNILKCLIALVVFLMAFLLTFVAAKKVTSGYFSETEPHNYPMTHWVMMGSHGTGAFDSADEAYTYSFETKEEKTTANIEKIIENYKANGISGTEKLWASKLAASFGNGYSECDVRSASDTKLSVLYELFSGDWKDIFYYYCQAFRILTLIFIVFAMVGALKKPESFGVAHMLCMITLLGGMFFYCLWEAKAIYSAPFVPLMLLLAASCDFAPAKDRVEAVFVQNKVVIPAVILIWILISVNCFANVCGTDIYRVKYSVRAYAIQACTGSEMGNDEFLQSFYAKDDFNSLKLFANVYGNDNADEEVYEVSVLDASQNVLRTMSVAASDVNNREVKLNFDRVSAKKGECFYVKLARIKEGERKLAFLHRTTLSGTEGTYNGVLNINGVTQPYDLFMSVFKEYRAPFISAKKFAAGWLLMTLLTAGLFASCFFAGRKK